MTLNVRNLGNWLLRALALLGAIMAAVNPNSLPASVRTGFAVASGIVLAVDRWLTDPSTGNPPTKPPGAP
ncbi:MAG TPA: hypothetical protein VM782_01215 [Stellaceae bacterium]|nr:hypothetical protein [Stellaceae bacterium]